MSCKYKYNNQWYTKEEVFNLLLKEKGINSKGGLIKPKITNNKIEGRTKETLKESIESVKKKLGIYGGKRDFNTYTELNKGSMVKLLLFIL